MLSRIKRRLVKFLLRKENYVITNDICVGAYVQRRLPKNKPTMFTYMLLSTIIEDMKNLQEEFGLNATDSKEVAKAMKDIAKDIMMKNG